jgi:hypothetical protein
MVRPFSVFVLLATFATSAVGANRLNYDRLRAAQSDKGKKVELLTYDMTKAEVEAILGQPIRCMRGGGSKSCCEQYHYTYQGDDGLAFITFKKDGGSNIYGPPGMQDRINTLYTTLQATQN